MARSKSLLIHGFEHMKTLFQYLYMDENHSVTIKNCIDVPLKLTMNDDGHILCRNMNYPDLPPTSWQENMDVETVQSICEQLMEAEPEEYKNHERVKSRWDEISLITSMNISQNKAPLCLSHIVMSNMGARNYEGEQE